MKRVALILIPLMMAGALMADEARPKAQNESASASSRQTKGRVFEIRHQDPRVIARTISLLGSGVPGTAVDVNPDLSTITVRDYPENIATIEEAIKRLDVAAPPEASIVMRLYVLVGSTQPNGTPEMPSELADVVDELRTTFRYTHYSLMTSSIHRTTSGQGIEGSGVAENDLVNFKAPAGNPLIYSYTLRRLQLRNEGERRAIDIQNFRFSMRMPVIQGESTQYIDVGFDTPVTIREGEKVVVGTTAMGDRALVVVVTTDLIDPGE